MAWCSFLLQCSNRSVGSNSYSMERCSDFVTMGFAFNQELCWFFMIEFLLKRKIQYSYHEDDELQRRDLHKALLRTKWICLSSFFPLRSRKCYSQGENWFKVEMTLLCSQLNTTLESRDMRKVLSFRSSSTTQALFLLWSIMSFCSFLVSQGIHHKQSCIPSPLRIFLSTETFKIFFFNSPCFCEKYHNSVKALCFQNQPPQLLVLQQRGELVLLVILLSTIHVN